MTKRVDSEPTLVQHVGYTYFPIALAARIPFAMIVVGMLTLVVSERSSLSLGGFTAAAAGIGTALVGPLLGAAADRWGQKPVLLLAACVNGSALVALALIVQSTAADYWVLAIASLIGASAPQIAPMSRSRLVDIIQLKITQRRRVRVLSSTMAYESAADEITFVFGPVIVGILATAITPATPIFGAAAMTLVSVVAFAFHPSARLVSPAGEVHKRAIAPAREVFRARIVVTVLGTLGMGCFFGATLTWLTSFMEDRGIPEQAGLIYGSMGVSSAVFALAVAWFPHQFRFASRWVSFAIILVIGTASLSFVDGIASSAVTLFVIGIGVGPSMVTMFHLAAERSPAGRSATVMTMLGSGVILGQSLSAAVTGFIAQNLGTDHALLLPVVAAAIVLATGIYNMVISRGSPDH